MLFEEADMLLESGYTPLETGYHALPNGQMHVAVWIRMPKCKSHMVEWWFNPGSGHAFVKNFGTTLETHHLPYSPDERPGYFEFNELGELCPSVCQIVFHDPVDFFARFNLEGLPSVSVVCANMYDEANNLLGRFIHYTRDTDFGCEIRSRYWLLRISESKAGKFMQHCLETMGRLADRLPILYANDCKN